MIWELYLKWVKLFLCVTLLPQQVVLCPYKLVSWLEQTWEKLKSFLRQIFGCSKFPQNSVISVEAYTKLHAFLNLVLLKNQLRFRFSQRTSTKKLWKHLENLQILQIFLWKSSTHVCSWSAHCCLWMPKCVIQRLTKNVGF